MSILVHHHFFLLTSFLFTSKAQYLSLIEPITELKVIPGFRQLVFHNWFSELVRNKKDQNLSFLFQGKLTLWKNFQFANSPDLIKGSNKWLGRPISTRSPQTNIKNINLYIRKQLYLLPSKRARNVGIFYVISLNSFHFWGN